MVTTINRLYQAAQKWIFHRAGHHKGNGNDRVRHSVDNGADGSNKVCEWATSLMYWRRVLVADIQESGEARKESGEVENSLGSIQVEMGIYCYTNLRNGYDIHEIKLLNDIYILWTLWKVRQALFDRTKTSIGPSTKSDSKLIAKTLIPPIRIPFSPP